jgi:citrate/tricarballylate utilization protein
VASADSMLSDALNEGERAMTICNACRYCEGLCAVFPAMELRRGFAAADLDYLANLCHSCGACYYDCQFAPPHELAVNVPRAFEQLRGSSYRMLAWPGGSASFFDHHALLASTLTAMSVAGFIVGFAAWNEPGVLFAPHVGPGAFYRIVPHGLLVTLFGAAFGYAVLALTMSLRKFCRALPSSPGDAHTPGAVSTALADAATLRNLRGGGGGCHNADDKPVDSRRIFHHLTAYGFLACFAATAVATVYHYGLGRIAPYAWYDLPVILGSLGGLGLLIGPAGLVRAKFRRDAELTDSSSHGIELAFLTMLFGTSLTGLLLLALRETPAMGVLLAVHLGFVLSFFLTLPYGKFVHAGYRVVALLEHRREQISRRSSQA